MKPLLFIGCFCLFYFSQAQPTAKKKGYVIYSLGVDTTFIGYYQLEQNNFEFKIMNRPGGLSVTIMKGSLYPNGELKEASGYSYKPSLNGQDKRLTEYQLYTSSDSTFAKQIRDGKETFVKYKGRAMVMNALGSPFLFLLPVLKNYAPSKVNETVESHHFVMGQDRKFTIKKIAPDMLEAGSNIMGYFKIYLDENGNVKSIDGIGSSWNVKGSVYDNLDLDAYIQRFTMKEEVSPLKSLTKRDSVLSSMDGVDLRLDYSRPSMRGRVIFGEVVPWNRVWRTGANEPTRLTINKPIYFNGKELPAGQYSVFTLPAKEGWTLIINKQTNIWGTDHDAAYDLMRIPMQTSMLEQPLELMTIELNQKGEEGILAVSWERTKAYVPFKFKK